MRILKLLFLGLCLAVIAFAIVPRTNKLPGQIAGTVANPLLINNKFCTDPASPDQTNCTGFISSVLAQTMSSPYQNVSGDVSISGNALFDNGKGVMVKNSVGSNGYVIYRGTDDKTYIGNAAWNSPTLFQQKGDVLMGYNGGNVGIGTLEPISRLHVSGANPSVITLGLAASYDGAINTPHSLYINIDSNNDSTTEAFVIGKDAIGRTPTDGGTVLFRVQENGNVGIGTATPTYKLQLSADSAGKPNGGSWANSSDNRLKKNVRPITNALNKISQLRGVDFEWINPAEHGNLPGTQGGFIAQDVEKIFPAWISLIDPSGNDKNLVPVKDKIKSLTLPFEFDALLVESIKEQQKQINALSSITDIVNKIGRFIQIETQKLIVSGVDILERLNTLSQKVEEQQKEIDLLKQQIETLKAR